MNRETPRTRPQSSLQLGTCPGFLASGLASTKVLPTTPNKPQLVGSEWEHCGLTTAGRGTFLLKQTNFPPSSGKQAPHFLSVACPLACFSFKAQASSLATKDPRSWPLASNFFILHKVETKLGPLGFHKEQKRTLPPGPGSWAAEHRQQ